MKVDWQRVYAAVWRPRRAYLRPVVEIDPVTLDALVGIDVQKAQVVANTERFLSGRPANNVLLWGARGTGKSSLVKALLHRFCADGLRLIQVDKEALLDLPEIVDDIRNLSQRFIVFCDDLSFEEGEGGYKALKSVLEGSIERPPENVLVYATSNRRHLLPEKMQENLDVRLVDGEIHYGDALEEKTSLADRFGLWISFYPAGMDAYLKIVDSYFPDFAGDRERLHEAAQLFAASRACRSGRTARQFYNHFAGEGSDE